MKLPDFFIDRSLGQHIVSEGVRQLSLQIYIHDQIFLQNTLDEDWIPYVGERGWAVFTADSKIMQRPIARNALKIKKVPLFIIKSKKHLTGPQYVEIIKNHLQTVKILASFVPPPFIAKLTLNHIGFEWLGSLEDVDIE